MSATAGNTLRVIAAMSAMADIRSAAATGHWLLVSSETSDPTDCAFACSPGTDPQALVAVAIIATLGDKLWGRRDAARIGALLTAYSEHGEITESMVEEIAATYGRACDDDEGEGDSGSEVANEATTATAPGAEAGPPADPAAAEAADAA